MRLCRDLGQTLETIMNLSVQEIQLWVAYYNLQHREDKRAQQRARAKR